MERHLTTILPEIFIVALDVVEEEGLLITLIYLELVRLGIAPLVKAVPREHTIIITSKQISRTSSNLILIIILAMSSVIVIILHHSQTMITPRPPTMAARVTTIMKI